MQLHKTTKEMPQAGLAARRRRSGDIDSEFPVADSGPSGDATRIYNIFVGNLPRS